MTMRRDGQAYRGHLIEPTIARGWFISKNTFFIGYAKSVDDARQIIDQLVG